MPYNFSFDRKSILLIALACISITVLVLAAGFIIGLDRGRHLSNAGAQQVLPASAAQTNEGASAGSASGQERGSSRAAPVIEPEPVAMAPHAAVPPKKDMSATADTGISVPKTKRDSAAKAVSAQSVHEDASSDPAKEATGDAAPKTAGLKLRANLPADDKSEDGAAGFCLQLGAFQNEENAMQLRNELKSRGYPVFMFDAPDSRGHLWHTVRLGNYAALSKASRAASAFGKQERRPALVRPNSQF